MKKVNSNTKYESEDNQNEEIYFPNSSDLIDDIDLENATSGASVITFEIK